MTNAAFTGQSASTRAAPSLDHFEQVARDTVATFPEPFRKGAEGVVLHVADWPTPDMLEDLQIPHREDLTGLYQGIPMTHKSATWPQSTPDIVWLFREPILAEWRARGDVALDDIITNVTVHEFAHHFGWSDGDIARIDQWWL
ncbi:metallopeptidase family protein [Rhodalgimonas zhirmunskyi]|uniref:Metallopeptidase family protein n=1 Tax=Rhodalgimonas zhirmunskyi TaxID=2964767 RepID=A0AAJ1U615_9RHOB|nr:metallopeptidase family protein [Rhodoalgimonas zhirmunskyi]MDQ2093674.1 metallopeptidase family protein [Rhodoalgimonas zhirmunskyi]